MNDFTFQLPEFVSVSDLQRNYPALLRELHSSKKPLLVLKKNDLEAVILLPEMFNALIEKVREYEEREALAAIRVYEKEKVSGKLKKMRKVAELFEG